MHYVRKFTVVLSSAIFLTLIVYSGQSVVADHDEPGDGIYKNAGDVNFVTTTQDSKWKISLQAILRTGDGQLINVTESSVSVAYIPHKITDHVFDTLMGEKEIVTIDNRKYEKVQYTGMLDIERLLPPARQPSHFIGNWVINLCQVFDKHGYTCVTPWQANTNYVSLEEYDIVKNYWNVLRIIN